jgi:hypothetical protein
VRLATARRPVATVPCTPARSVGGVALDQTTALPEILRGTRSAACACLTRLGAFSMAWYPRWSSHWLKCWFIMRAWQLQQHGGRRRQRPITCKTAHGQHSSCPETKALQARSLVTSLLHCGAPPLARCNVWLQLQSHSIITWRLRFAALAAPTRLPRDCPVEMLAPVCYGPSTPR